MVDKRNSRLDAALQSCVEIVDGKADVVDPGAPFGHEPADRGTGIVWLKELHQRLPRAEPDDARSIGVIEIDLAEPEHLPEKRQGLRDRLHGDPNVGNPRSARG